MNDLRSVFLIALCAAATFALSSSVVSGDECAAVAATTNQPAVQHENQRLAPAVPVTNATPATPANSATPAVPVTPLTNTAAPTGQAAVGALFTGDGHYCTASVVHSDAGDLVLTAAHCIHEGAGGDYLGDIAFAPGYHDGTAPYGLWTATNALVAPGWIESSDPALDFGFLIVHQAGNPRPIESLTGANQLGIGRGFVNQITLTGYPDDTDSPVVCQNSTSQQDEFQMRIACVGFPDGTSGGPWVTDVDPATKLGTVIGVIGGYQLGGDDPDVSYSSYFDNDIDALYAQSSALG